MVSKLLQAESVKNAAWGIDWIGAAVQFQRSVCFIIAVANKEFRLTAGKFVPVCNSTLMNVRIFTIVDTEKESIYLDSNTKLSSSHQTHYSVPVFYLQNRVEAHS